MILALFLLALSIACYSVSQSLQHKKFKWMSKNPLSFWGESMDKRKYTSKLPFATTFLVFLTDSYHLMQFFAAILLSFGFTFAIGFSWWRTVAIWMIIHLVHWATYKFTSKENEN